MRASIAVPGLLTLLILCAPGITRGQDAVPSSVPSLTWFSPDAVIRPGGVVRLFVKAEPGIDQVQATLASPRNKPRTFRFFRLDAQAGMWVCIIAPGSFYKAEESVITMEARGASGTLEARIAMPAGPRAFLSETIALDARNTGIRTKPDPEKTRQAQALQALLGDFRTDVPVFVGKGQAPVASERRTSHYGDRRVYAYSNGTTDTSEHKGIDWGVPAGTPVQAGVDGVVLMAEQRITTGWTVVIGFGPGLFAQYYHLESLQCSTGDRVSTATVIGKSGATGLATGPHLHFEVQSQGLAFDPDLLIGATLLDIEAARRILFPVR